ncbi:hypothetical protein [Streptomyces sp. E-15]
MAQRLDTEAVRALVKDATAAPSMYNAQPWRFQFLRDSSAFHLRADLTRAMPRCDPDNRALHLGCGAALFNLRVAAAHAGWQPTVELLPDPADSHLLAVVRLTDPVHSYNALADLYPALHRRHTSREPFAETEIPCWEIVSMPGAYPSLTRALAEALVDVLWFVEGCEDEQMDPDDAVKVLEGVAHVVSKLSREQQDELLGLLATMAREESDPSRRAFLEEFPESFGLVEDAL